MLTQEVRIHLQEFTTPEAMEQLRPQWSELWGRATHATPFQSPEWLIPWWRHFGEGAPWILAMQAEGRLVSLIPLYVHRRPESTEREVLFLGTGLSDYLGGIFEPEFEAVGTTLFIEHLILNAEHWDCGDFHQLPHESLLLKAAIPSEWKSECGVQGVCPVLPLPSSMQRLDNFVPLAQLENLRCYRERIGIAGRVTVETANAENFEELFQGLLQLHRAQAMARGQAEFPKDNVIQQFHSDVARGFLASGLLRLYALRINHRIAATFYGFCHRKRFYYFLNGVAPDFAQFGLGSLLVGHAIEQAVAEGCEEFDFLRGRETYKSLWGGRDQFNYRRRFHKNSAFPYGQK